jgi:hypothetical protein
MSHYHLQTKVKTNPLKEAIQCISGSAAESELRPELELEPVPQRELFIYFF